MTEKKECFVVGMGASAGGLKSFQAFFTAMPADSGMAFVLVQHLHPYHESMMPELLAKHTDMPVHLAMEEMELEPDHVYVIPSNTTLTVSDGKLHIEKPREARGHRMPIDHFFMSLSKDYGEKAICIILSGTGSDGTLGLKSVKEYGGLVVAQSLESAQYDAMPRSAIRTGLVDMVLDTHEMPDNIVRYWKKARTLKKEIEVDDGAEDHLETILTELELKTSHEFKEYKRSTILRRISRRMQILRLDSLGEYARHIREEPEEARQLFKNLLIGVTHFFRDRDSFDFLQQNILPQLLRSEKESDDFAGIRVWVPGCATGEEAYTLAMLIREEIDRVGRSIPVTIFATDIDEKALSIARQAVYPEGIEDFVPERYLKRYFIKQDNHYHLDKTIREMCLVSPHNLISDPPYSRIDLIVCRNLLIYFDTDLQGKILPVFHYSLRSRGYLFLGSSEHVSTRLELFRTISKTHKIFQARQNVPSARLELYDGKRVRARDDGSKTPTRKKRECEADLARVFERSVLEHHVPFSAVVNENGAIIYWAGQQAKYLDIPRGAPSNNLLELAHKSLRTRLRGGLYKVTSSGKPVEQNDVLLPTSAGVQRLRIMLRPFREMGENCDLVFVVIEEVGLPRSETDTLAAAPQTSGEEINRQLEEELKETREYLQATIQELESSNEELKSSNEELLSTNEELQSSNEELQTSQEELQSSNEELETVNTELKSKVLELDEANSDLQNLYESSNIATLFIDGNLRIKAFTPACTEVIPLIEADISRPVEDVATSFRGTFDLKKEAEEVVYSLERRSREITHEATGKHYIVQIRPYRTVSNVIDGVTVSFVDVTDLRETKEELEVRERILRLVTDAAPALIAYVDSDRKYKYCNSTYYEWFGLTKEEVEGRTVEEVLGKEGYATIRPQLDRAFNGESIEFCETLVFLYDGEKTVDGHYEPHIDKGGNVCGVIVYIQDISERTQKEKKLGRLAAIIGSSREVIIGKTMEGVITDWNRGAEELYGYTAEEAIGRNISLIIPPDRMGELESAYDRLDRGEDVAPFETVRLTKTGEEKHITLSLATIKNEKGEAFGISAVAHDITDRVEMERQLEALNEDLERRVEERTEQLHKLTARFLGLEQRERRRFSEYLHDEIQQSVAAAKLIVEQVHGDAGEQDDNAPLLSETLRLLNEVIASTRSITMDMSPPLFFENGISICLEWLARWAKSKLDLQVETAIEGEDRAVAEEAGYLLYRSMRELLYNIFKHAAVKRAMLRAAFADDGSLEVVVRDQGGGFDLQEVMDSGAEHFGVLSIMEQVKAMTGTMTIDSAEGEGTRIAVALPAEVVAPGRNISGPGQTAGTLDEDNAEKIRNNTDKKVVLIVDDQEDLRFTLRMMLEEADSDYTFLEAEEASQAIAIVKQYRPQLVLMDVSMPGMSGVEATRKIKAVNDETVVIGLSMHEREDMEEAMRQAGADHYITKDAAAEKILATIDRYLNFSTDN